MPGAESTIRSSCVCESMNPGATIRPLASMTTAPFVARFAPTAKWIAFDSLAAAKRAAPVPSMTVPPRKQEQQG